MYEGDKWMTAEMVERHKGIAAESEFALAMYRWANKIIEFVSLTKEIDEIGIHELDIRINNAKKRLE